MVKSLLFMVFLVMIMFISGCTSQTDVSNVVKSLPQVQEFLKDHPNADIRAAIWDTDAVSDNIDSIREDCGEQMRVKKMWKVEVSEDNQDILVWLDGETNEALCIVKHSTGTDALDKLPEDEDKINCQYANIEADRDTAIFDSVAGKFEVNVENTGTPLIILSSYEITTDEGKRTISNFNEDIEIAPKASRMLMLNIKQDPKKVKIAITCDGVFDTITRPQGGWNLKESPTVKKNHCEYINIELDRDYAKFDSIKKIFYAFVSNTGADAITITKVESWVDNVKQLPIMLDRGNFDVTGVENDGHKEIYIDLKSAFRDGGTSLTKIKFITECDPVFDTITQPQGGWNSFTWSGETLANIEKNIHCQYSNIEIDRDYAKWDSTNKIFYTFVSNTGVDTITVTKVECWVDNMKQLPITLDRDNFELTGVEKYGNKELYVDLKSAFKDGGSAITKIKFITECDPVFDTITQPQGGWNSFTWSGEALANR